MVSFFTLPTVLACEVLCSWTSVADLKRVYAAYTPSSSFVNDLVHSAEFIVNNTNCCSVEDICWLTAERIKFNVLFVDGIPSKTLVQHLLTHGQHLQSVRVHRHIPQNVVTAITEHCRNISYLHVCGGDSSVLDLLEELPNLQQVELWHTRILPHGCTKFHGSVKPLVTSVKLMCGGEIAQHCFAVVGVCPNLLRLTICSIGGLTPLPTRGLIHTIGQCRHLRALSCNDLNDAALRELGTLCPHIVHLDIRFSFSCTDIGLLSVITTLKLKSLCYTFAEMITNVTMQNVLTHCSHTLTTLYVDHSLSKRDSVEMEWPSLCELHEKCTNLQTFTWYTLLGDKNVQMHNCSLITYLVDMHDTTDNILASVAQYCTNLTHLDLYHSGKYPAFTSIGLRAVTEGCRKLKCIYLHPLLDRSMFAEFAADYPGLMRDHTIDREHEGDVDVMKIPI